MQLYHLFKGTKEIQSVFLGICLLGVGVLIYSDAASGITTAAISEAGTLLGAVLILAKLLMSK